MRKVATAVASAYSDPDKEIISHYKGEVWCWIMMMMINIMRHHQHDDHKNQGLDTALKCCYEDIEDTLTVPPEVR